MKRRVILLTITIVTLFLSPAPAIAQTNSTGNDHTAREELEGKDVWEKLQAKQLGCKDLTNDNFGALGEYFMGQSIGNTERHAIMNQMMTNMMGEESEKQMHITLGKRLSGCEPNAQAPANGIGFMPMMFLLRQGLGGQGLMGGGGNSMMGYGGWGSASWLVGILGWLSMLVFWVLLILGVVALIRHLSGSGSSKENKTPLDILKRRYARGEIDKNEFEEKKKDLA